MTLKERLEKTGVTLGMSSMVLDPGLYIELSGDYNDGDEVQEVFTYTVDDDIEDIIRCLRDEDFSEFYISGVPDAAEIHTYELGEVYLIDDLGDRYDINIY